jgi:hypothetical protein
LSEWSHGGAIRKDVLIILPRPCSIGGILFLKICTQLIVEEPSGKETRYQIYCYIHIPICISIVEMINPGGHIRHGQQNKYGYIVDEDGYCAGIRAFSSCGGGGEEF